MSKNGMEKKEGKTKTSKFKYIQREKESKELLNEYRMGSLDTIDEQENEFVDQRAEDMELEDSQFVD